MKLTLLEQLNQFMRVCQGPLFPALREELAPLTEKQQQVLKVLNLIRLEACVSPGGGAAWAGLRKIGRQLRGPS